MLRWSLILGGLFNFVMGFVFFSNELMEQFFHIALRLETMLFSQSGVLVMPQDELHLLLIHGFGAAAMILGATLIYSVRDAVRIRIFYSFDKRDRAGVKRGRPNEGEEDSHGRD